MARYNAQSRLFLDLMPDPVIVLNPVGLLDYRNSPAAERLHCLRPGISLPDFLRSDATDFLTYLGHCQAAHDPLSNTIDLRLSDSVGRYCCYGSPLPGTGAGKRARIVLRLRREENRRAGSRGRALVGSLPGAAARRRALPAPAADSGPVYGGLNETRANPDAVDARLYRASQAEQVNLAREIHDHAGQHVVALTFGLTALERHVATHEGKALLGRLQRQVATAAQDLHRIMLRLRPAALDESGLDGALRVLLAEMGETCGIIVDVQIVGETVTLAPEIEMTLFRVIQEALSNVLKHARGAKTVSVIIQRTDDLVSLTIEDDGAGFLVEHEPFRSPIRSDKFGLLGMRERLELVGGALQIESRPGAGTTIFARIGLNRAGP
ncbi:MAG TPA: sensor histidine kinase [Methylobacterium sp.]